MLLTRECNPLVPLQHMLTKPEELAWENGARSNTERYFICFLLNIRTYSAVKVWSHAGMSRVPSHEGDCLECCPCICEEMDP